MNYKTEYKLAAVAAFGIALWAGTAWAHHNMAVTYDFNNRVMLTGTLTKIDWRNPHIELTVENGGKEQTEMWALEGPSPSFFRSRDIGKSDLETAIGKTVVVEASRAKDGSHSALLRAVTLPDGRIISACPQNC